MDTTGNALESLGKALENRKKSDIMTFKEYLAFVQDKPHIALRSIFQLLHDMVKRYVGEGEDEYPNDPNSIGFVKYDCSRLLVAGADSPFFADRLFANRFVRQMEKLKQGFQQNRIYAYEGPSGCGKSTFLNNLLQTLEAYTHTEDGVTLEIAWHISESLLCEANAQQEDLLLPCPSHDHPILIIPKEHRKAFLQELFNDPQCKSEIFSAKEYEWIFRGEVCTICKSIFESSLNKLKSPDKVFGMVKVRPYKFDRRVGQGISIFNPGDKPLWDMAHGQPAGGYFSNSQLQEKLDQIFGIGAVRYIFSDLAKTNNGIYVLMDVKGYNGERLLELHNVISEGVHKVSDLEEHINSLFFALMNPEDRHIIDDKKMESFHGRIQFNKIPYVLEPATEVNIYTKIFGNVIFQPFLPRVLQNFAKVVIASRMKPDCKPLKDWIKDMQQYSSYCDEHGFLLRMEIYSGVIPDWLSEGDRKNFTASVRRDLIAEGEVEGSAGFSGRDSIQLFGEFLSIYSGKGSLITMDDLVNFFKHKVDKDSRDKNIPKNFLASLLKLYNYAVLNEVKESLYFYNPQQIMQDILNYLLAINYDIGNKVKCDYTGDEIFVTVEYFKQMASRINGREMTETEALSFAEQIQKKYTTFVAQGNSKTITETELYAELLEDYTRNLKDKALEPFLTNKNFLNAVKAFGTADFDIFDDRLKEHVSHMLNNLMEKFGYTEQGAKQICIYVVERNLVGEFQKA